MSTEERSTTLYRFVVEVEQDTSHDADMVELGRTLHRSAMMCGRAASTQVVAVFNDARSAGNVLWRSRV